jgi:DNA-binding NtrC family response regulator
LLNAKQARIQPISNLEAQPDSGITGFRPGTAQNTNQFPNHKQAIAERHILIVEDEAVISFALEMELEDNGAIPLGPMTTLRGALDMLDDAPIDAAILDIDLNGVDVYPLADLLIERGISFVFYTANGTHQKLRDVYPTVPVCVKPTNSDEVLNALAKVLWDRGRN